MQLGDKESKNDLAILIDEEKSVRDFSITGINIMENILFFIENEFHEKINFRNNFLFTKTWKSVCVAELCHTPVCMPGFIMDPLTPPSYVCVCMLW